MTLTSNKKRRFIAFIVIFLPQQGNTWNKHVEDLLMEIASRVLVVIHGHRHVRYAPVRIHDFQFAAHPFGYPHEHSEVEDGYTIVPTEL